MVVATTRQEFFPGSSSVTSAIRSPVMDAKQSSHLLKGTTAGDLVKARRNLALISKGAYAAVRGSPVQAPGYMSFDSDVTALDTLVSETADMTLMVCFRRTPGAPWTSASLLVAPMALSNVATSTYERGVGIGLVYTSATTGALRGVASYNDASGNPKRLTQAISVGAAMDTWRIAALTVTSTGMRLYDLTTGAAPAIVAPDTSVRAFNAAGTMLIGGAHNTYGGLCDVAMEQMWNRVLTVSELAQEAAAMQARCALQGVAAMLA